MNRKEVREWLKGQGELKKEVDELRRELETKDLRVLLSMVELSEVALERVRLIVIAEYIRSQGIVSQSKL